MEAYAEWKEGEEPLTKVMTMSSGESEVEGGHKRGDIREDGDRV